MITVFRARRRTVISAVILVLMLGIVEDSAGFCDANHGAVPVTVR